MICTFGGLNSSTAEGPASHEVTLGLWRHAALPVCAMNQLEMAFRGSPRMGRTGIGNRHTNTRIDACIYIYIDMCVDVYIYIYIYLHLHLHIYHLPLYIHITNYN